MQEKSFEEGIYYVACEIDMSQYGKKKKNEVSEGDMLFPEVISNSSTKRKRVQHEQHNQHNCLQA